MAKGLCERIGIDGVLTHTGNKSDEKFKFDIAMPTHKEAIQSVINILLDPEKGVNSVEEALLGANDIIAEDLSDDATSASLCGSW